MAQNGPQLTDERLRSWLDANQLGRERLCLALLSLDARFLDVRPRHPRGGKDHGRDLEARLKDGREIWGAIGFRNRASDSEEDLHWAAKKFKDDLTNALKAAPKLKGFVFMTNVELPIASRTAMEKAARAAGVEFVDVFHRERLRILLDSPDGLAARFQYLGIPLSDAEQAAFFARWGADLEKVMARQFASVDRQLARLEFLQACLRPLRRLGFSVHLHQPTTPASLGHFRILVFVGDIEGNAPFSSMDLCLRSGLPKGEVWQGDPVASGGLWLTPHLVPREGAEPDADPQSFSCSSNTSSLPSEIHVLGNSGTIIGMMRHTFELPRLGDLDGAHLAIFVTAPLASLIASLEVFANEYTLLRVPKTDLRVHEGEPGQWGQLWPEPLEDAQAAVPWVRLDVEGFATHLRFSSSTPVRSYLADTAD